MFWGAFSFDKRTSLWALRPDLESPRKGITARSVLECLKEQLPTIVEPGCTFIQDNAPTHTALCVKNWLTQFARCNLFHLVKWPPYSPDLNPIENLWKLLKEGICKKYPELSTMKKNSTSLEALRKAAEVVWEGLEEEVLERLILSMPRRLEAIVESKGWYSKY